MFRPPAAVEAPVPPSATAKSVIPVIDPPVMDTLEDVIGPVTPAVAVTAPVKVEVPVTANVVLAVIALAAKVVLLTVAVPVAAPRFKAVAAPPRFKVVETVLNADCVAAPTNAPARVVVPDAARVVNAPVAGVVAPTVAPSTCGGYTDVTWTYRTNNNCGISISCNGQSSSNGTITVTRRFTVAAPAAVTINAASNVTIQSCKTQAQVNSAWNSFLASTTVSGGCSTGTLTHNAPTVAPSACGGYVDVTWTYRSNNQCGQTISCNGQTSNASTYTVTRRFTVQSGGEVEVAGPSNVTYANTSFTSQAGVNNAFNSWLCQFRTVRSGCGACAVFSGDNRCAPSWSNGGTVRVTYSISGNCNSDTVTATFTITRNGNICRDIVTKGDLVTVTEQPMDVAFAVKAYPNPFSETFNLDVASSAQEKVAVAIYDMAGKLIEQRQVDMSEISAGLQIGDRYASGVYNVIVTQGGVVKTLRVIKR